MATIDILRVVDCAYAREKDQEEDAEVEGNCPQKGLTYKDHGKEEVRGQE